MGWDRKREGRLEKTAARGGEIQKVEERRVGKESREAREDRRTDVRAENDRQPSACQSSSSTPSPRSQECAALWQPRTLTRAM